MYWGESPDRGDGQVHDILCFDPEVESIPLTASDQVSAIGESATGIRTGAGRAVPPTGGAAPVPLSQGTSGWRLLAVALGIGVVLYVASSD